MTDISTTTIDGIPGSQVVQSRHGRNAADLDNRPSPIWHHPVWVRVVLAAALTGASFALSGVALGDTAQRGQPDRVTKGEIAHVQFAPKPLLRVDGSKLGRGLAGLEPAASAASMDTVTLEHDGSVSAVLASLKLLALLASEPLRGGPAPSTNRTVVGADNRTQITDASSYPYSAVGLLGTEDQNDVWSTCTATLIGPRTVLTAAHCVYDIDRSSWAKNLIFIPGTTDADKAPRGKLEWYRVHVLKGFITNYDGADYASVMPWDIAEIELSPQAGLQSTWMPISVDTGTDFKATMIGYPADELDGTMWKSSCEVSAADFSGQIFTHSCDSAAGSSGSAMFEEGEAGSPAIRGINVAEDPSAETNYAVRLSGPYRQFLIDSSP